MNHRHHDVICAMARGERAEYKSPASMWKPSTDYMNPFSASECEWRIAPKTLNINGMEFPTPRGSELTTVFGVHVTAFCELNRVHNAQYYHESAQAAKAHYDAILKASTP